MSKAMDRLATQYEEETVEAVGSLNNNIRQGIAAGMSVEDVMSNFKFPETVNPYQALASVALGEHYRVSPERAYGIYPYLKEGLYPNISDEELVGKLFASTELPESTVKKETHEEKAAEVYEDFPAYAQERKMAEAELPPHLKDLRASQEKYEKQTIPLLKQQARKHVDDEWFGKGSQTDITTQNYYDALFLAKTEEERQAHTQTYIKNLGVQQKRREAEIKRLEYQLENRTYEESFKERKSLAWKRAGWRYEGTMSRMGELLSRGLEYLPGVNRENLRSWGSGQPLVTHFQNLMRHAAYRADAPELWRQELNAWDGMTNALIENAPTMALSAGSAVIGTVLAGPVGTKAGIFWAMGCAESAEVYTTLVDKGFSEKEATKRADLQFLIAGGVEAATGGVTKYMPKVGASKKLLHIAGKFGSNLLKEWAEETVQEGSSMILGEATPYLPDGRVDTEALKNQYLILLRDTAFMSSFFSGTSQLVSSVAAHDFKVQHGISKDEAMYAAQELEKKISTAEVEEKEMAEKIAAGESFEGEDAYTDALYIKVALKLELPIVETDQAKIKKHPFALVRNTNMTEMAEGLEWHIKNFHDPTHNLKFDTYKEALAKFQELAPREQWTHAVYQTLSKAPAEVVAQMVAKSPDWTENLENIDLADRVYLKHIGEDEYEVWDADTGTKLAKAMSFKEAMEIRKAENIATGTEDPVAHVHRYAKSRADNGAMVEPLANIADLTDKHKSLDDRKTAAKEVVTYLKTLRDRIIAEDSKVTADEAISESMIERVSTLPDLISDLASDRTEISNLLREVIRMGQMYGDGMDANMRRNWIAGWVNKVKPYKYKKPVLSEKDAKQGMWGTSWDILLGTSKDDHISTAVHLFGNASIPLSMKIIQARTQNMQLFNHLRKRIVEIEESLDIGTPERKAWSQIWNRHAPTYDLMINGQPHQLTMSQIMYTNLIFRDPSKMKLAQQVGLSFQNYELGIISEDEMIALTQILAQDRKALAFVDALHGFYTEERADVMNVAGMEMYGHPVINNDNFLPTDQKGKREDGPLLIKDVFGQSVEDARRAAHFAGIKPVMLQISDLLNNRELELTIQRAGKTKHLVRFRQEMEAMAQVQERGGSPLEKVITRLGANRARSILANGRIAVLQAGSYQLYQNATSTRYLRGGHGPQTIYDTWDLYQFRAMGMGSVHSVASESTIKKSLTGKSPLLDYTLYPMHKVDLAIIKQGATIAWHEMTDTVLTGKARRWWDAYGYNPHDFKKMSPEFLKALHDRADYIVSTTQPMFFPESRNAYSTSDNAAIRELARFRSFTDQLLRNNARQIALWRMGEVSNREMMMNVGRNMIFASVWYNGLRWLFDMIFADEEEEQKNLILEIVLGPLSWVPFLGWSLKTGVQAALSRESGYGPAAFSTITADQVSHTVRTAVKLGKALNYTLDDERDQYGNWKSEKYWEDGMREAAKDILIIFFGLPDWLVDIVPEKERERKKHAPGFTAY